MGLLLLFLLLAAGVLCLMQPVIPSRAYVVTAMLNGQPMRTELMTPLFLSDLYYVHVPDAPRRLDQRFGVSFSKKSVFISGPRSGWLGFPYIHNDQAYGLNVTSGKFEIPWKVAFTADGVQFSRDTLSIVLHRR